MRLAQHMAVASERIRADCIEAGEFAELARRYSVMAVPKVVINDRIEFEGALPEREFLKAVLQAVETPGAQQAESPPEGEEEERA